MERPPLHPTVVHLPFVLWGMSFVFDVVSLWRGPSMVEAALFNLVAGLVAALAVGATGIYDYRRRLAAGSQARRVARWHAAVNGAAAVLFVISLATRLRARGAPSTPELPFVLSGFGLALMGVAMYLGGIVAFENRAGDGRDDSDAQSSGAANGNGAASGSAEPGPSGGTRSPQHP